MYRIIAAALTLLLAGPACAGFDEGKRAYDGKDYATAIREWRPLAEHGNAKAQLYLGIMYGSGFGVSTDFAAAAKWYRKAAEQGYGPAQINLGLLYSQGAGVPQDHVRAQMWMNIAAENRTPGSLRHMAARIRDTLLEKLTAAEVAEAKKLAERWREKQTESK